MLFSSKTETLFYIQILKSFEEQFTLEMDKVLARSKFFPHEVCWTFKRGFITANSALSASQNRLGSYPFIRKPILLRNLLKTFFFIITFIFHHRAVDETRSLNDKWYIVQTPFCDAAVAKSTVM
jgi:hypothetical protein